MPGKMQILLSTFAKVILDIDDTAVPKEQYDLISAYPERFKFDTNVKELDALVKVLKKKHLVDSLAVIERDGSVIASSNSASFSEGIKASALLNYISSELPNASAVLVKGDNWYMLYPYRGRIYLINAETYLTTVEMKAIAREIELFFAAKIGR